MTTEEMKNSTQLSFYPEIATVKGLKNRVRAMVGFTTSNLHHRARCNI